MINNSSIKLAIVMDHLELINIKKDSTYAMIKEASYRNWSVFCTTPHNIYVEQSNLYLEDPCPYLANKFDYVPFLFR